MLSTLPSLCPWRSLLSSFLFSSPEIVERERNRPGEGAHATSHTRALHLALILPKLGLHSTLFAGK